MPLTETFVHCYNVETSFYSEDELSASSEVGLKLWHTLFELIDPNTKVIPRVGSTKYTTTYSLPQFTKLSINYEDLWNLYTYSSYGNYYYTIELESYVDCHPYDLGDEIYSLHLKWLTELKSKYPKLILVASTDELNWEVI